MRGGFKCARSMMAKEEKDSKETGECDCDSPGRIPFPTEGLASTLDKNDDHIIMYVYIHV